MSSWFRNLTRSLNDMKQLKMRIPGLGGEVTKRLGGQTITLPFPVARFRRHWRMERSMQPIGSCPTTKKLLGCIGI